MDYIIISQWALITKTNYQKRGKTRVISIGMRFASDWLREWREFSGPITERVKAKTKESRITFDTYFTFQIHGSECTKYSSSFLQHTGRLRGKISDSLLGDVESDDLPDTRLPPTF